MQKFDVVVVGAGTGGCTVAKKLSSYGFGVCLVDYKAKGSIGDKVCGDAVGKHHFDDLGLAYPSGDELERLISGVKIYSPDMETIFYIIGEGLHGFMINRRIFGQRLLKDALDAGATLLDSTKVVGPIIEDGYVRGVIAKAIDSNETVELKGEVVVDASGVSSAIRSKLPPQMEIETKIDREDLIIAYREIRKVKETPPEPDLCEIYLNLEAAPGGYYWIFPKSDTTVNVGLGVVVSSLQNPKELLYRYVFQRFHKRFFDDSSPIHGGGGFVPTRRPLGSIVGNGFVVIGDAACHVNPIHGGGIGPSMVGGTIAADVISKVLEESRPSREELWPINVKYMQSYGAKQTSLDVFRIFLQGLTDDLLNYGMKYRLIKDEDVLKVSLGEELHLNITEVTRRIFRGMGRLQFLNRLRRMANLLKEAKAICQDYPVSPEGFPEWRMRVQRVFERAKSLVE
ncbi:MAG: geranylgeranyl hydrogenase [Candidatus Bathyarchaeota archaeon B26-2]|nr:MAG: geranylgeranyl hydrogenase [Candidatus Bathyarchaeota archaeon B26-2]